VNALQNACLEPYSGQPLFYLDKLEIQRSLVEQGIMFSRLYHQATYESEREDLHGADGFPINAKIKYALKRDA
jgi:hypothetical protein